MTPMTPMTDASATPRWGGGGGGGGGLHFHPASLSTRMSSYDAAWPVRAIVSDGAGGVVIDGASSYQQGVVWGTRKRVLR